MAFARILGLATTALVVFVFHSLFVMFKFAPAYSETYHVVNFYLFIVGIVVGWNTNQHLSDRARAFVDSMSLSAFVLGVVSFFYKFATLFNV